MYILRLLQNWDEGYGGAKPGIVFKGLVGGYDVAD